MFFLPLFEFVLGLVFGSFIAALTYRFPRGISNLKGRSFCDNCKKQIRWFDNIPLFSYILLKGKCRNCKSGISLRYPLIELATGIGFLLTFKGEPLQGVYNSALFLILEAIFIIDLEHQIIPDLFTFLGITLVFLQLIFSGVPSILPALFAGFAASVFLLMIHIATKGSGMGLGDVKFAVFGGMITGLALSLIWLFTAFLTGAIVGIILILGKKAGLKSKIAFGPFLVIAIPITLLWGQKIIGIILPY